jgi:aspartyl protease family protein
MKHLHRWAALAVVMAASTAWGQSVSMSGSLGTRALLMIDGRPVTVAVGSTVQGVKLISVSGRQSVVEVGGKRITLDMGGAQVNLGGAMSEGTENRITLVAGPGGHFMAEGSINNRSASFMVDTGATTVAMSQADADRIGLKYRDKPPSGMVGTANGNVPAHKVTLNSVRVGNVQVFNVEALIVPQGMPYILLGNSFLTRFQMKRENDVLTLDRK